MIVQYVALLESWLLKKSEKELKILFQIQLKQNLAISNLCNFSTLRILNLAQLRPAVSRYWASATILDVLILKGF